MCPVCPEHMRPSSKCLHPVPVISQEGIAFSAFVQVHSACVDLSDSSWKLRSFTSCRADSFLCNFCIGTLDNKVRGVLCVTELSPA